MLRAEALEAYGERVDTLAERAGEAAGRAWDAMMAANPLAGVAEVREGAIEIVRAAMESYGDASAELGASLYDELARANGADVPPAELPEVGDGAYAAVDASMRYAVRLLVPEREDI